MALAVGSSALGRFRPTAATFAVSLRRDLAGGVGLLKTTSLVEGRRSKVEVIGFIFGVIAFVVAMVALGKTRKLEKQLKEAGVLKERHESG